MFIYTIFMTMLVFPLPREAHNVLCRSWVCLRVSFLSICLRWKGGMINQQSVDVHDKLVRIHYNSLRSSASIEGNSTAISQLVLKFSTRFSTFFLVLFHVPVSFWFKCEPAWRCLWLIHLILRFLRRSDDYLFIFFLDITHQFFTSILTRVQEKG